MAWHIERTTSWVNPLSPNRWEWMCANTAYGMILGYARTKRQAERRLLHAETELYLGQRLGTPSTGAASTTLPAREKGTE